MDEIEAVLGIAMTLNKRGEPLPLDLLARADALGVMVSHLDQPTNNNNKQTQSHTHKETL